MKLEKFQFYDVPLAGCVIALIAGWFLGDVLGVIAAFFLIRELVISETNSSSSKSGSTNPEKSEFYRISLLKLSSLLIKVDGNVDEKEVKFVRDYFKKTFGEKESNIAFKQLNSNLISDDINVLAMTIKKNSETSSYYAVLMYLYSIAAADGFIDKSEDDFILKVAKVLNVEHLVESVRNQFIKTKSKSNRYSFKVIDALKLLGLKEGATKEDIKKAYRKLVKEFHPDKLAGMDKGFIKMATEKFLKVQNSYEYLIKNYV